MILSGTQNHQVEHTPSRQFPYKGEPAICQSIKTASDLHAMFPCNIWFRDCHYDLHQPPCGHSYQSNDRVKHGPSVSQPHLRRLAKWEFKIWCQMSLQTRTRCLLWTMQKSNNRTLLIFGLGWPKHTPVSLLVSTWIIKSSSKTREFPDVTPSSIPFSDSKKAALSELLFIKKVQMTIRTHSPKKQEVIPLVDWTRSIEVYPWYMYFYYAQLGETPGQNRIQIPKDSNSIQFTSILFIQH